MKRSSETRWVLAFDASCAACQEISDVVSHACDAKLEILPLAHEDVERWREEALGPQAAWAPALLRIRGTEVRAWTGPAMGIPLVRRLGPRSTLRVVAALGELKRQKTGRLGTTKAFGRQHFLRLGAGAATAVGLIMTGRTPAFATADNGAARAWARANKALLPQRYDEVTAYPMPYRKEIWKASSPRVRSTLWSEQLRRYRASHPDLSAEQATVLDRASAIVADESLFIFGRADRPDVGRRLGNLPEAAVSAFGREEAHRLFGILGTGSPQSANPGDGDVPGCNCNYGQDAQWKWCNPHYCIHWTTKICGAYCCHCGMFWASPCDGQCL